MSKTVTYHCDICSKKAILKKDIQVIFLTEQNEGRSVKPYLDVVNIDLCNYCLDEILNGKPVFATGAMGHNTYSIPTPK